MIPKQMFFIWIGDNQPDYINFSIESFKKNNPDFDINFLRYNINEIENIKNINKSIYDIDVYNCINHILNNDKYQLSIDSYKSYGRKFCQILVNILRLEIISKYGGIYLDCDTFSIKPFDNQLLNRRDFCAYTCTSYDWWRRHKDCHFLGSEGNNFYYEVFHAFKDEIEVNDIDFEENTEWKKRRLLFYKCKLSLLDYNNNFNYYIEHFVDRTWKTNRTPICKYDK